MHDLVEVRSSRGSKREILFKIQENIVRCEFRLHDSIREISILHCERNPSLNEDMLILNERNLNGILYELDEYEKCESNERT